MLQEFINNNWFLVFFIYGLAFFLMGFGIAFHHRRRSTFRLSRYLWLLAGFGFLHGAAEWAYILFPPNLESGGWESLRGAVLNSSHAILLALSFTFLLSFGWNLLIGTMGWKQWLNLVPVFILILWSLVFIFNYPAGHLPEQRLALAEIASRYLLALPGALLTSFALYLQRDEIRGLQYPPLERVLLGAAAVFVFYAFAGGLVVPYADIFPARLLNTGSFLALGIPIQLLRTAAGILMAYFVIRSLDLFEIENRNRLAAMRQREFIWLERERIRRDLHDGVIQSIYALALGLDHAGKILHRDPGDCGKMLKELRARADLMISELRLYLKEMKMAKDLPPKAVIIIEDLLADFAACTGLVPKFSFRGSQEKAMDKPQREHFYHMTAEILSNIRRHSGAMLVHANLDLGHQGLRLTIRDNGVGIANGGPASPGIGLLSLRERAALAGGLVNIKSTPGEGTEVTLWLPYKSPEGEDKP